MNRYGVPTAPEGCGNDPESGPCESCTQHTARRGKWAIRQLLPLQYATYYFTGGDMISAEPGSEGIVLSEHPTYVNIAFWRMWFGRVFAHQSRRWPIAV